MYLVQIHNVDCYSAVHSTIIPTKLAGGISCESWKCVIKIGRSTTDRVLIST